MLHSCSSCVGYTLRTCST